MPSSGYTAITFVANEQPTTAKWNLIGSNDASFNTMAGMNDNVLALRHIPDGLITPAKRTLGFKSIQVQFTATGTKVVTGIGFKPKAIIVLGHNRTSGSECTSTTGMAAEVGGVISQFAHSFWSNGSTAVANASSVAFQSMTSSVATSASVTSFDSDGFTCNATAVAGGSTTYQMFNVLVLG